MTKRKELSLTIKLFLLQSLIATLQLECAADELNPGEVRLLVHL